MTLVIPAASAEVKGFFGSVLCYILAPMTRGLLVALLLFTGGCAWLRPAPTPILPAEELYGLGEADLERGRHIVGPQHVHAARDSDSAIWIG